MMWLAANRIAWNEKLFRDTGRFDRYGAPGTITMQQRRINHNELTIKPLPAYNPRRKARKTSIYARQKLISFKPSTCSDLFTMMVKSVHGLPVCTPNYYDRIKQRSMAASVLFDIRRLV
ncbi:hypothetical protein T11_12255 [Trichinella zimbabwensis]|uniref:Uncharacterized protein n=1 Tax=Trichinella zimbabwensis TaxID=268475 RepID=A0A0V1GPH8_9BILA|nr:hypothetical protein T11_12255 [Trichinella zimbabwensis]